VELRIVGYHLACARGQEIRGQVFTSDFVSVQKGLRVKKKTAPLKTWQQAEKRWTKQKNLPVVKKDGK